MIKNRLGFSFPLIVVIGGGLLSFAGLISAIENPIIGVFMILVGSFFWSNAYGIQIDTKQNRFREFGSLFGIKNGKWHSLDNLPYISILKNRSGTRVYSMSSHSTTTINNSFVVCLLNHTHRKKFIIKKFNAYNQALSYAENISNQLSKSLVSFNPTISSKTKNRKRSRR